MNITLRHHAMHRAASCRELIARHPSCRKLLAGFSSCRNLLVGLRIAALAALALPATARTVYDAGKALRQNFQNNATPVNPYTDENGGKWYYSSAAGVAPFTSLGNFASSYAKIDNNQLQGWGGTSSPHLKVNITGHTLTSSSFMSGDCEPIEADELVFHPGQSGNSCMVLRFVAPEAGWYSAFVSFHDTSAESPPTASSGASVYVTLGDDKILARGVVSLEGVNGSTRRFDFQMPVRYLAKDTEIRFAVNNNKGASGTAHANDATGVKVFVTKEDEGSFYDSGIALTNNIATTYTNPFGTIANGAWCYLLASIPAGTDLAVWAPSNFINAAGSRIVEKATRPEANSQRGFAGSTSGTSPYVLVNETAASSTASTNSSSQASGIAPCELHVHPKASDVNAWPVIRFRPPVSGYYSASIVARDVICGKPSDTPTPDGVHVYLLVSGAVVTNAYISAETFSSTAHLTFESRLLVANEPVDIAVFANASASSDATGVSAIFRCEGGDVYDAGKSFYADHAAGNRADSFTDLLGGDATWQLGAKTNAWCGSQFYEGLTSGDVASSSKTKWWLQGRFQSWTEYPYFLMITNGVASADSSFDITADIFAVSPHEFAVRPNDPGYQSSSPTIKAVVPSDGVYRVRSYVRDLNNNGGDGVRASVVANGHIIDSSVIWRLASGGGLFETALGADRLWLNSGDSIEYVVDPQETRNEDPTGISACYLIEESSPSARVINIDFGVPSSITGRFSDHNGAGREGWSDWNKWNALRISNSTPAATVSVDNCREADGMTKRNVTLTLARTSGNVTKGYTSGSMPTGSALHNNWAVSSNASDTYTFTLSKLKANESYTLYLYSAKGGAEGNASFTVGGVTKTPDETWNLKDTKVLARFDATSDANGQITGTFTAADSNGGAFNGLTVVGEFPDYVPEAFVLTFR